MTKKTRRILLISLAVLFLLAAPSITLYSLGYRIDFANKKITQTGGFYFKVWPRPAQVFLDGKAVKRTDLFFGAAYIDDVLPKEYEVEIKKDGYHAWRKTLKVAEKQVTDAKNIVLLPLDPGFEQISTNVERFFFSPDERKIILVEVAEGKSSWSPSLSLRESSETEADSWALKLVEPPKNVKSHLVKQADFSKKEKAELVNLTFSDNSQEILLETTIGAKTQLFTLALAKLPAFLSTATATKEATPGSSLQKDYHIDEQSQTLYLLNKSSGLFEPILQGARGARVSPDGAKLLYFSEAEIGVFFPKQEFSQPQRQIGEKVLLARFSQNISDVFWLGSHYIVFSVGEKIKVAEIDDRGQFNIVDLVEFAEPKIFFNQAVKRLYVLSQGTLYVSQILLP